MENHKIKKRVIAIDFSKDKARALRILEDEKRAREKMRKSQNKGIRLPKDVRKIMEAI